jgi:hypothetical protein
MILPVPRDDSEIQDIPRVVTFNNLVIKDAQQLSERLKAFVVTPHLSIQEAQTLLWIVAQCPFELGQE